MTADSALIVIDLQNDFCPGGRLAVAGGDEIVPLVNALQAEHGAVVLTQDWHPGEHASFAANHPGAEPFSMTQAAYGPQVLWPVHCVQGTPGAAFHPDLAADRADLVIRKGFRPAIDSYSAFFENDHETPTGLAGYLRERGITDLEFCGLATDFCVSWSAIDARAADLQVSVIEDAVRGIDINGSVAAAWASMRKSGVARIRSSDIA